MRSPLFLALLVAPASCFTPAALPAVQSRGAAPRTIVMVEGRRAALATFGLAALAFPLTASADSIDAWRLSKPLAMVVVTALETSMRKGGGRYGGGEGGGKR